MHARPVLRHFFPIVSLFLIISASPHAQSPSATQLGQGETPENAPGVTLSIRFSEGRSRFFQGDKIAFEMLFTSSLPNTYELDAGSYDRSGRINVDRIDLEPSAGWVDPLDDYFNSGLFSFMMGGIRGMPALSQEPIRLQFDLNEWARFDQPGIYRLRITSPRVSQRRDPKTHAYDRQRFVVTSNILEFEVVPPDPAWQSRQLKAATNSLDSSSSEQDKQAASRMLRFLGSRDASTEMAQRIGRHRDGPDWELRFGLIGSSFRAEAIQELDRALDDPSHPVSFMVLDTVSTLAYLSEHHESPLALPRWGEVLSPDALDTLQAEFTRRRGALHDFQWKYVLRLAESLPKKEPRSRAATLQTLLGWLDDRNFAPSERQEDLLARVAAAIPSAVDDLSGDELFNLLEFHQAQLKQTAMVPLLIRIAENPPETIWPIRESCLRILEELAPSQWRRLILTEIVNPHPKLEVRVLARLPDSTIPEFDGSFAANIESCADEDSDDCSIRDLENRSFLLQRFATKAILPRVRKSYEGGLATRSVFAKAHLLAYFVRTDPKYAATQIEKNFTEFAADSSEPSDDNLYVNLLNQVAAEQTAPELRDLALRHLVDQQWRVVVDCANFLSGHGSGTDEQILWRRLDELNQTQQPEARQSAAIREKIERALVLAVAQGSSWWTGPAKLKKLAGLCASQACREDVKGLLNQWTEPLRMDVFADSYGTHLRFAHYDLESFEEAKGMLARFPKGTSFKWEAITPDDPYLGEKMFAKMEKELQELGLVLFK